MDASASKTPGYWTSVNLPTALSLDPQFFHAAHNGGKLLDTLEIGSRREGSLPVACEMQFELSQAAIEIR